MPFVRKRGKRWEARALVDGGQIGAGSHATRAEAWQAAIEVERQAKLGNVAGAHGKLVRDILERYAEEVSTKKRGARWEQTRLAALGRCAWASLPADRLTPEVMGKYRDKRLGEVKGSTIIREFNLLSEVFNVARKEWRWLNSNPLTDVRRPPDSAPRKRRLIDGELERLRVASGYRPDLPALTLRQRAVAAAEWAVETAMRSGEICALTWVHVHSLHAHIPRSKTGAERDVPTSVRAQQILAQLGPGEPNDRVFGLTDAQRDVHWRAVRDMAGIDGLTFHDLRREGASRLAKKYDVLMLAKITGHKDLRVLMETYYAPTIEELAEKMR